MSESLTKLHELVERIDRDRAASSAELAELGKLADAGRVDYTVYDKRAADEWYSRSVDLAFLLAVARWALGEELDTESSASRQHYIDTGEYLRKGEAS